MILQRKLTAILAADVVPRIFLFLMAQDHFALGHHEEAARLSERRLARQPESHITRVLLAACYGWLGRADQARAAWQEALRINPDYSARAPPQDPAFQDPAIFVQVVAGLRKAGLAV